ncbi:Protein phosphatase 1 regulatory subunit 12B [Trichoplax sp. H2]|nr:Protein phosphatase 1 regulatory subunit 12B [Trichoplax sp. H2]|eukprot:RDD39703.1 Protein phosphatase 1 regulatory subunit 12B [Trichoplax sp. H2]
MALRGSNDKRSILLRRMEQLKEWENSDTNKESNTIKSSRRSKIKFGLGTMFFAAVSAFDETEVKRLLKQGVDIDYCNNDGLTALHQSCMDGNDEMVSLLVENGADVNICDFEGWTPLIAASSLGHIDIARYLLEHKADISKVTVDGETAIDVAEGEEMEELLRLEVEKRGLNLNLVRDIESRKMLEDANKIKNGTLEDLIDDRTGATALHVASAKGYKEVVKILLAAKVNVNAVDFEGWTPLHAAAHWEQADICELLVENNADLYALTKMNEFPKDVAGDGTQDLLEDLMKRFKPKPKPTTLVRRTSEISKLVRNETITSSQEVQDTESNAGSSPATDERSHSEVTRRTTARQRRESRRSTQAVTKDQIAQLLSTENEQEQPAESETAKKDSDASDKVQNDLATKSHRRTDNKIDTTTKVDNKAKDDDNKLSPKLLENSSSSRTESKRELKSNDKTSASTNSDTSSERFRLRNRSKVPEEGDTSPRNDKEQSSTLKPTESTKNKYISRADSKDTLTTSEISEPRKDKYMSRIDSRDSLNTSKPSEPSKDRDKTGRYWRDRGKDKDENSSVSNLRSRFNQSDSDSSRKGRTTGKSDSNDFSSLRSRFTDKKDDASSTSSSSSTSSFGNLRSRFSGSNSSNDTSDSIANRRSRLLEKNQPSLKEKESVTGRKYRLSASDQNVEGDNSITAKKSKLFGNTDSSKTQENMSHSVSDGNVALSGDTGKSKLQDKDRPATARSAVTDKYESSNDSKTKLLGDRKLNFRRDNDEQDKPKLDFRRDTPRDRSDLKKSELHDSKGKTHPFKPERQVSFTIDESASDNSKADAALEKESTSATKTGDALTPKLNDTNAELTPKSVKMSHNDSLLDPKSAEDSINKGDDQSSGRKKRRTRDKRRVTGAVFNRDFLESDEDKDSEKNNSVINSETNLVPSESLSGDSSIEKTKLIDEQKDEIRKLNDLCQSLQLELNDYKVKLEKMTQQCENLQKSISENDSSRKDEKNATEKLKLKLVTADRNLKREKETAEELRLKMTTADRNLRKEKESNRELERSYQDLKERHKDLEKRLQHEKDINKELAKKSSGSGASIEELETLRNDNKRMKDENSALIRVISKLSPAK